MELESARLLEVIDFQTAISGTEQDPETVMRAVVGRAQQITRATGAALELADGRRMVYRVTSGSLAGFSGLRLSIDGSLSGLAVKTGELQYASDAYNDDRVDQAAARKVEAASMLCVPLVQRGEFPGVLKVVSSKPDAFDRTDVEVLRMLSGVIAAAMTRAKLIRELTAASQTDPLTGLMNRRGWEANVPRELARVNRTGEHLCVAMIDLDRFKAYNDAFGHLAGDELLVDAAQRWTAALRTGDLLARFGGEEFIALLPACEMERAVEVVARLREATPRGQTFSAGVASSRQESRLDRLVDAADSALYVAKRNGRNCTARFFSTDSLDERGHAG